MKVRSYGKCVLSGEHSVLRDGVSLLFPLKDFYFDIFYQEGDFKVTLGETFLEKKYLKDYQNCIQKALVSVGGQQRGHFHLECTLPIAAGLGSSAAFCLGVARIFFQNKWILKTQIPYLSLQMENEFHGQSSGGDVRVIEYEKPLLFKSFDDFEIFKPDWKPYLYLYDTGIRTETKKCIEIVKQRNHSEIDKKMKDSVIQCMKALKKNQEGFFLLQSAMNQACECFKEWGLCPPEVQKHIQQLKNRGAFAVKPTGSGGGGFLMSLWKTPQPSMISVF